MKVRVDGIVETQKVDLVSSSFDFEWDEIAVSYPDSVTEEYTYKLNTATVKTYELTYTDSGKTALSSVVVT